MAKQTNGDAEADRQKGWLDCSPPGAAVLAKATVQPSQIETGMPCYIRLGNPELTQAELRRRDIAARRAARRFWDRNR